MKSPAGFLIDLDDTLYSERSFVDAGYRDVASFIAKRSGLYEGDVFARLTYEHQKYGRANVFNRVCCYFDIIDTPMGEIVENYRACGTPLTLYKGVKSTLKTLAKIAPIAIVTDGATQIQKAKVARLGVADCVSEIIYAWELKSPKPSPVPFNVAARKLGIDPAMAVIIGDDPYHDGEAAKAVGARFVRVRTGKYKAVELSTCAADYDIKRFSKLEKIFNE